MEDNGERLCEKQYEGANKLFDTDIDKCIEMAKHNLT